MLVVDASVVLELLLRTPRGVRVAPRLLAVDETLCAPHLLDVETAQVLRRYFLSGDLDAPRGHAALQDLADLPVERYPHHLLLDRIWELRDNLTACDAAYVALAELLAAPLLTCDTRILAAPGHAAKVELI